MIALDKLKHLAVGLCATVIVGAAVVPLAGVTACAVLGWAKERWDKRHPDDHTADGWDAYATLCGAVPGLWVLGWLV